MSTASAAKKIQLELQFSEDWLARLMAFAEEQGVSWKRFRLTATDALGDIVSAERQPHLTPVHFPVSFEFTRREPEAVMRIDWSADGVPCRCLELEEVDESSKLLLVDWSREGLPASMQRKATYLGPKGARRRRHEGRSAMKPAAPTWGPSRDQQETLSVAQLIKLAPVRQPPCPRGVATPFRALRIQQPGGHKATSRGGFARR